MYMKLGKGRVKYVIKQIGEYYYLVEKHRTKEYKNRDVCQRAGMLNPWTWEDPQGHQGDHVPPQLSQSTHAMTDEYITVRTSPNFKHDIRRITFVKNAMTIADLKVKLSAIFKVPVAVMKILDGKEDQELPGWTNPMSVVQMEIEHPTDIIQMTVRVPTRDAFFHLQVKPDITPDTLELRIATILGVPHLSTYLTTMRCTPWLTTSGMENQTVVAMVQERAGMRRDISPTEYILEQRQRSPQDGGEDEESEEVRNMYLANMYESAHDGCTTPRHSPRAPMMMASRSRSRSRHISPATSMQRGSVSPTRHGYWSRSYPFAIASAQSDPISKVGTEGNETLVGYVWADPGAVIMQVMQTLRLDLHLAVDVIVIPTSARLWRDVEKLDFENRPIVRLDSYKDMRLDRWELFQKPRIIPMLYAGTLVRYMVFPWTLSLTFIQHRLDLWASSRHSCWVQAVDDEAYVIVKRDFPQRVITIMDTMSEVPDHKIQRAGIKIKYAYAHDYEKILKYDAYNKEVIAESVCHISDVHGISTHDVIVTTDEWLSNLEDRMMIYSKNILYVILFCYLEHDDYKDVWPWHIQDIKDMAVYQRGTPKHAVEQPLQDTTGSEVNETSEQYPIPEATQLPISHAYVGLACRT